MRDADAGLSAEGLAARHRRAGQRRRGRHRPALRELVHRDRRRTGSCPTSAISSATAGGRGRAARRRIGAKRRACWCRGARSPTRSAIGAARARWRCSSSSRATSPAGRRAPSSSSSCSAGPQNINHLLPRSASHRRSARRWTRSTGSDGPFDAHRAQRRRPAHRLAPPRRGRFNIPSVGVFVWRLRSLPVTQHAGLLRRGGRAALLHLQRARPGRAAVRAPQPETDATHIADELNLPAADPPPRLRRRAAAVLRSGRCSLVDPG